MQECDEQRQAARSSKNRLGRILVVQDGAVLALTIEALGEARPNGIALDVRLPDRDDGWEMAKLVEQLRPTLPPIVFSTGLPEEIPGNCSK